MKFLQNPKYLVIAQFVLLGLLFFWPDSHVGFGIVDVFFEFCGVIFFFIGLMLVIMAIRQLFKQSLPKLEGDFKQQAMQAIRVVWPEPSAEATLVVNGVFRFMRHPIYAGLLWIGYGIGLSGGPFPHILFSIALHVVLHQKSILEEKYLAAKFPAYEGYSATAGRFWPKVED